MPRKRIIDPSFWTDPTLGFLAPETRLLYIASWNLANDAGLLDGDSDRIRAEVFPYDARIKVKQVDHYLAQLVDCRRLLPYEVHERRYFVIVNFHRWQRIAHPAESKLPKPPADVLEQLDEKCRRALLSRFDGVMEKPREDSRGFVSNELSLIPNSIEPSRTESKEIEGKGNAGRGNGTPEDYNVSLQQGRGAVIKDPGSAAEARGSYERRPFGSA